MSHLVTPTFPDVGDFTSETPDSGAVLRALTLRGGSCASHSHARRVMKYINEA